MPGKNFLQQNAYDSINSFCDIKRPLLEEGGCRSQLLLTTREYFVVSGVATVKHCAYHVTVSGYVAILFTKDIDPPRRPLSEGRSTSPAAMP